MWNLEFGMQPQAADSSIGFVYHAAGPVTCGYPTVLVLLRAAEALPPVPPAWSVHKASFVQLIWNVESGIWNAAAGC